MNTNDEALRFDATINNTDFIRQIDAMEQRITSMSGNFQNEGNKINGIFSKIGETIAGSFSISDIVQFGLQVMETTSEFERFQTVLTNTLGSKFLADSTMSRIQEFAATTPFSIRELTDSFIQLSNQGFIPTSQEMTKMGDLAANTGSSFNQLAQAILGAQSGEYDRLNEFGIKAKDAGDKVIFTFRGVATEVNNTASAIREYIIGLGNAEGVTGSMVAVSGTLGEQLSKLKNNWDILLKSLGKGSSGLLKESVSGLNTMMERVNENLDQASIAAKYNLKIDSKKEKALTLIVPAAGSLIAMQRLIGENTNQASHIQYLKKGLDRDNGTFMDTAKWIREYSEEFSKLDQRRQKDVKAILKSSGNKELAHGVDQTYKDAMSVLKDQAIQIIKTRSKVKNNKTNSGKTEETNTNTGSNTKTQRAKSIANVYQTLANDLSKIDINKKLSPKDIDIRKIQAYEKAINSLIDNSVKPSDKRISGLFDKMFGVNIDLNKKLGLEDAAKFEKNLSEHNANKAGKAVEEAKKAAKDFQDTIALFESTMPEDFFNNLASPGNTQPRKTENTSATTKKKLEAISKVADNVSNAFSIWGNELQGVNDELAYTVNQISRIAADVANLAYGISTGDAKAIAAGGMDLAAFVFTANSKTKAMNAAARAEVRKFYDDAAKGEMSYQALVRRRELDTVARGKNSYNAIIDQLESLKKQSPEIEKAYNDIFSALQGEEYVQDVGYKHGTWFRKAKTWDIMASLAGSDYSNLESLYTEGKLKDQAKSDFEALKALKEELEAVGLNMEDLQKQLGELLTGTSTSGLSDSLTELFANGKLAAQDLGDSFESIMRTAITNTFKYKYLEDKMQPFYEALADMMEGGATPTEAQIEDLKKMYLNIGEEAAGYWQELEKITGEDLSPENSSNNNSLQGSISASLTEETGTILAGHLAGLRLEQIVTNDILRSGAGMQAIGNDFLAKQSELQTRQLATLAMIEQNTGRSANNTDRLETIEGYLSSMDRKISNNYNTLNANGRI